MELKELRSLYWRAVQIVDNSEDYELNDAYNKIFSEDIYGQLPFIDYKDDDIIAVTVNNFLEGFQKYINEVEARESNKEVEISEFTKSFATEYVLWLHTSGQKYLNCLSPHFTTENHMDIFIRDYYYKNWMNK